MGSDNGIVVGAAGSAGRRAQLDPRTRAPIIRLGKATGYTFPHEPHDDEDDEENRDDQVTRFPREQLLQFPCLSSKCVVRASGVERGASVAFVVLLRVSSLERW